MILSISNFKKLGIGSPLVIDSSKGSAVLLRGMNGEGKTSVRHAIGLCIYGPRLYKEAKRFFPKTNGADTVISMEGIPLAGGRTADVKRVVKYRAGAKDTGSLESVTFLDGAKVPEKEVLALFPEIEAFMSVVSPEHFFSRPLVDQVRFLNSLIRSDVSEVEKSVVNDEMEKIRKQVGHGDVSLAYSEAMDYLLAKYCLLPSDGAFSFAKRESGDEVANDLLPSFVTGEGKELPEATVKAMYSEFGRELEEAKAKMELLSEQRKQAIEKFALLGISPESDGSDSKEAKEILVAGIVALDAEIATADADLKAATVFDSARSRVEGLKWAQRQLLAKYEEKKAEMVAAYDKRAKEISPLVSVTGAKSAEFSGIPFVREFADAAKRLTETAAVTKEIAEKSTARDAAIKAFAESFGNAASVAETAFESVVACYASEETRKTLSDYRDRFLSDIPAFRANLEKKASAILEEMKNGTEIPAETARVLASVASASKSVAVDGKKMSAEDMETLSAFAKATLASSVRQEAPAEYAEHRKALEALAALEGTVKEAKAAELRAKTETEKSVKALETEIAALEASIKPETSKYGEALSEFLAMAGDDVSGKTEAIRSLRSEFETERAKFSEVFPYVKDYAAYEAGKRTYLLEKNSDSLSKKLSALRNSKDAHLKELSKYDVVAELRRTYRSYDEDFAKYSEMRKCLSVLNVIYRGYHKKLWSTKRDLLADIVEKKSGGAFRIVEDDARLSMEMRQDHGGEEFYSSDFSRGESILAGCFFSDILDSLSAFSIPVRFFDDLEELDNVNRDEVYRIILDGIPEGTGKLTFVTEVAKDGRKKKGLEVVYGTEALGR